MFERGEISTRVSKAPFIFTVVTLVCSIVATVYFFVQYTPLGIFASIIAFIMTMASLFVLLGMLSDYAYIDNKVLYMHYLYDLSKIALKDIKYIELKDNLYHVYDENDKEVGTINALALGVDGIVKEFYRYNIPFK